MLPRRRSAVAVALVAVAIGVTDRPSLAQKAPIENLNALFSALKQCWRPPHLPAGDPGRQITVKVSFKRDGEILGKPRITFESPEAGRDDSLAYRVAVMETLQRCTPLPFTPSMGGAVAGRPFTLRFDDRRQSPRATEKRAWLITTTS
ncbi:TonB C-terminal domain-containing protein [Rhodopseudomonas sp. BR0M22]|uniref:TonB C-terminal domain-containing protein n=1 Tax=Rhodopseudomonas sp. BR0M22 TaxID=2269369 RepID=UPI0013DF7957|nr:TonB C-terminal domain-containing protein [Rhodopseudomonas sp. BR0M22]NEW92929.1 hypothetical protein [Rhodopseudomonas sp. BR0M22]